MNSVEQIIDAEIHRAQETAQRLQDLKKLAADPKMIEVMREIVAQSNGVAEVRGALTVRPAAHASPRRNDAPPANKSAPNGLTDAVTSAVGAMKGRRFVVHDLQRNIESAGFKFVSTHPRVAISTVLEKLVEEGPSRSLKSARVVSPTSTSR